MDSFGQRLKHARTSIGLSQAEMAERCRVTPRLQAEYEGDHHLPSAAYLLAVDGLGADAGWILTGRPSLAFGALAIEHA